MPKVSVIIPTYNCERYLPDALESVFKQSFRDFEVVIVDDGSTDGTQEAVKKFKKKYGEKVNYVYQENRGLACARNTAIRHSRGKYIAILDADDMFLPDRLKEGVKAFEEHPEVGLVHANIFWMSEAGRIISTPKRDVSVLSGRIFRHIFLRNAHVSISTVLVKKECFDSVGLFDENLSRLGCEDREMWLRISNVYPFLYIDRLLGLYRIRHDSMSRDKGKMLRARYYVVDKFCPPEKFCILRQMALARIHRDLGDEFFQAGDIFAGTKEFARSILLWPFGVRTWIDLPKSFLKAKMVKRSPVNCSKDHQDGGEIDLEGEIRNRNSLFEKCCRK